MAEEVLGEALAACGVVGGDGFFAAVVDIEAGVFRREEVAAFAKDAAQDFWDGEDELAVKDFVADGGGDPGAGGADAALVAGGAEVATLAGEGEELFVAAVRAVETGKAGCEVAATEEGFDGGDGPGTERAEGFAVVVFVVGPCSKSPMGGAKRNGARTTERSEPKRR